VVGLRPKMYSLTYDIMRKDAVWDEIIHTEEKKVAKGIAKCEIKKNIASCNVQRRNFPQDLSSIACRRNYTVLFCSISQCKVRDFYFYRIDLMEFMVMVSSHKQFLYISWRNVFFNFTFCYSLCHFLFFRVYYFISHSIFSHYVVG
jgi:hypothetical protein